MNPETLNPEARKFRIGENAKKPYGGKISNNPFSQTLYKLAASRGYETQKGLARALGKKGYDTVAKWYKGSLPNNEQFGKIIYLLKPTDKELGFIVDIYKQSIREKKRKRVLKFSSSKIKPAQTPIGIWIEGYIKKKNITLKELLNKLEFQSHFDRNKPGLDTLSQILQNAPKNLMLTPKETDELTQSVTNTIEQKIQEGHRFADHFIKGARVKKMQRLTPYRTFTGPEAGQILSVSKETIRLHRKKLGIEHVLLTEEDIEAIKGNLKRNQKPT